MTVSVGQAGLGYWGKNLARNFDELAELRWLADATPAVREQFARRYPNARVTGSFDDLCADPTLDAVVIATPVPTHYALAKQALEAGQARLRREAARDEGGRDGGAGVDRGRAEASC